MDQDASSFPKQEECWDSPVSAPSPPARPPLLIPLIPIETTPVPLEDPVIEHFSTNALDKERKQHTFGTVFSDKMARETKREIGPPERQRSIIVIDPISDDAKSGIDVKNEVPEPHTPMRAHLVRALYGSCPSSKRQSPPKAEQLPEITPFSQFFASLENSHEGSPDSSPVLDPLPTFDSGEPPFDSSMTSVTQLFSTSLPSNQRCPPRKLRSIGNKWRQDFIDRQRSPPRRAARRKQLKAKRPLMIPKLSGGRKFKIKNIYQEFSPRVTVNSEAETRNSNLSRGLLSVGQLSSKESTTQQKASPSWSEVS